MYVFLDESGDLGFNFTKRGTTNYFVLTILVVLDSANMRLLEKAVEKTRKNKILRNKKREDKLGYELKGSNTDINVKSYFLSNADEAVFDIYAVALNKRRVYEELRENRDKLYNYISKLAIEKITFGRSTGSIILTIDKSKNKVEILDFNRYIERELHFIKPYYTPLIIYHTPSHENKGIQAGEYLENMN